MGEDYKYDADQESRFDHDDSTGQLNAYQSRARAAAERVVTPSKPAPKPPRQRPDPRYIVPENSAGEIYRSSFPDPDSRGVPAPEYIRQQSRELHIRSLAQRGLKQGQINALMVTWDKEHSQ